jgi:hypothetical protein
MAKIFAKSVYMPHSDTGRYNLFPTGKDCSAQIQHMWDHNVFVRPCPGTYYLDHPVYGIRKKPNGSFDQFSGSILGPGNAKNAPDYMNAIFISRRRDSSAFYIQQGKGCTIQNIAIRGMYTKSIGYTNNPYLIATSRYSDWSDGGTEAYAAIAVDAFPDPNGGHSGSTGVDVVGCQIRQFSTGISYEVRSGIQNGDECNVLDCEIDYCKICLDYGQDQTKGNKVERLKVWGGVHTVFSTSLNGRGCLPFIDGVNIAGGVYQVFWSFGGNRFTGGANNIYAEMIFKIGGIGGRPMPGIYNSTFDFINFGWWPDFLVVGGANFYDCHLRYYNGQINRLFLPTFPGGFFGGDMERPITAGLWQGGVYSDTPTIQHVRQLDNDGAGGKAIFYNNPIDQGVILDARNPGKLLSIDNKNYEATILLTGAGQVAVGDYILAGQEVFHYYDAALYSPIQSTTYVGRVKSVNGKTAVLDQVGISMLSMVGKNIYWYKDVIK